MRKRLSVTMILSGLLCIVSALSLTAYNLVTERSAGAVAKETMVSITETVAKTYAPQPVPLYQIDPNVSMPETDVNGVKYIGYLHIPSLGLELPIITKTTGSLLQVAPCRLSGTAYLEDMVIGAHNYSTHFGNLKKLHYGDSIEFIDMDGNHFAYEVGEIEILQPDQLEYLCSGEYPLSLYTCTIGGRTRLTVRCLAAE
ncbi:MAG: sortase [Oscillospiraceae bacterium]|nr:sortase [Oscillospiraceae bacterium]